jgi:C-terminal processing protease CtpA/Prc
METIKKLLYFCSLLLVLTINFSCGDDPDNPNEHVNQWILSNMKFYYLWTNHIPAKTNNTLNPDKYFESLLYTKDRFSWIQENFTDLLDLLSGIQMEAGYDYNLMRVENSSDMTGIITYIKPNSPASRTDLKRGDLFNAINNTKITITNYLDLLGALSAPHTLGIIDSKWNPVKNISLPVTKYEENPVLIDTVYNIAGKKIAYLVYNFFADDKGDNSFTYAKELNAIFGAYKTSGIDELILDLRYNSGGAVTTCTALSSMISNKTENDVFGLEEYNSIIDEQAKESLGPDYYKFYFADYLRRYDDEGKTVIDSVLINKLPNLSRLYVITSSRTASASELVINGLKPYMDVILIGGTTYGKNVGSITIYEADKEKQMINKWGMQPIVVKLANASGFSDYADGFPPNMEIFEHENLPFIALGNTDEPMLAAAFAKMGVKQAPASFRTDPKNRFVPLFSSIDKTPVRRNTYIKPEKLRIK